MSDISSFSKNEGDEKRKPNKTTTSGQSSPMNLSQQMFQTHMDGKFFMPKLAMTQMSHYMATPTKYSTTRRSFF